MDTEHNIKNKSRPKNNIIDFIRLADIISIGNILSGLASIFSSINGNFKIASVFLFLAVIFDYYDGKTARKTNTENDFGKQIDSLCDITSFIIAPVIFAYSIGLQDPIHMIIYSIYTATGVLRLARYNITGTLENGKYFEGLPVPASIILPPLYFIFIYFGITLNLWIILYLIHAILMVSTIKIRKP